MEAVRAHYAVPLAAAALQFSLRDPRILSTIVGISRPERLAATVALARQPVPEDLWQELESLFRLTIVTLSGANREEVPSMDLPIVDSHVHLWNPQHFRMPWLAAIPRLNRPYGLADYATATQDLPVAAMVYVETGVEPAEALQEARWIASLAQHDARLQAIVAAAPLELGLEVRAHLAALAELGPRIKGVRRNLQDEDADFCLQPAFLQGIQMLATYGFSFDICINHRQLPGVIELVRQCPETAFVLDHMGKPAIKQSLLEPWHSQVQTLATLPNVSCKISGIVTEADQQSWQPADLLPFLQTVFAAFGSDRVMFGGDWPVVLLASTYRRWYETLQEWISKQPSEVQRKLWYENARRFYRLEERG